MEYPIRIMWTSSLSFQGLFDEIFFIYIQILIIHSVSANSGDPDQTPQNNV